MTTINILSLQRLSDQQAENIKSVDSRIELIVAGGWFDGEIRETWPDFAAKKYLPDGSNGHGTRAERDALLQDADIILGGWPYPFDLRSRAPKMKWFHQTPAGANNLLKSDMWGTDVIVTTSRGYGNVLGIAEYAVAGIMHFAKGFNQANVDQAKGSFNKPAYKPLLVTDKTMCVVGAGGIGQEVGRLSAALGMRVVGTRSQPVSRKDLTNGFDEIGGPADLLRLLSESHFVAVCCQLSPATTNIMDQAAFAAMPSGGIITNVARGEVIDEDAMLAALDSGHLRGAALDVYCGEFEGVPGPQLWNRPDVLITPHNSGATDDRRHTAVDLFCTNLKAYLEDEPLINRIDWARGY